MAGLMGFLNEVKQGYGGVQEENPTTMDPTAGRVLGALGGSVWKNLVRPGIDAADYLGGEVNRMMFPQNEYDYGPTNPAEVTEKMTDVGMLSTIGGGLMGPKGPNTLSTFGGREAANFPQEMLPIAENMMKEGIDQPTIWKETGLAMAPDGKWRFEIDDSLFKLNHDPSEIYYPRDYYQEKARGVEEGKEKIIRAFQEGKIDKTKALEMTQELTQIQDDWLKKADDWYGHGDVNPNMVNQEFSLNEAVTHKKLMDAYPAMGEETNFSYDDRMLSEGSFNPSTDQIKLSLLADDPKGTAIHEIQHNIQKKEGFAPGGSPEQFLPELKQRNESAMNQIEMINRQMGEAARLIDRLKAEGAPIERVKPYEDDYQNLIAMREELIPDATMFPGKESFNKYQNLMGEVESNTVIDRLKMTANERRENFPEYLGRDDMIIKGPDGLMESAPIDKQANFDNWFGGSKIVDEDGEPLQVFHGTNQDFESFDPAFTKSENGLFFTDNSYVASNYANSGGPSVKYHPEGNITTKGSRVIPANVSIKNPYIVDMDGAWKEKGFGPEIQKAKRAGHDGVIIKNTKDVNYYTDRFPESDIVIPFEPTQIKSIWNDGTYNPNDPNILKSGMMGVPRNQQEDQQWLLNLESETNR